MTSEVHIGDNIHQSGHGSIGKVYNQGPVDSQATLREMVTLAMDLRARVTPMDRDIIDESVEIVRRGRGVERDAFRRALGNLIGIATMAGAVGGPALDVALKLKKLFGL
jgi:hypothetical protein